MFKFDLASINKTGHCRALINKISLSVSLIFLYTSTVQAGEITDIEWDTIGNLIIRYHLDTTVAFQKVSCTIFNESNLAIAGGSGYVDGGVATVYTHPPDKYFKKALSVRCTP